jgi:hypothetical protein
MFKRGDKITPILALSHLFMIDPTKFKFGAIPAVNAERLKLNAERLKHVLSDKKRCHTMAWNTPFTALSVVHSALGV